MSYPVFLPLFLGAGKPPTKGDFIGLLILGGIVIAGITAINSPKIQMKVTQANNYSANVDIRRQNYPNIQKITHKNIDCLKQKGYSIVDYTHNSMINGLWYKMVNLKAIDTNDKYPKVIELTKEKLIQDCKECDVSSEIIYSYDSIFGNEKQKRKNLYWHKCYQDELK